MTNVQRSKLTTANQFFQGIEKRIKRVFNHDVFSFYDGIIEKVDLKNGTLDVRIPLLGNAPFKDCKFMLPCCSESSVIYPIFKVNTPVIVGFKRFSLGEPIVFGFVMDKTVNIPIIDNTISIVNENYKMELSNTSFKLTNGTSTIILDEAGIRFTGPTITANGEDLTIDDEGAV